MQNIDRATMLIDKVIELENLYITAVQAAMYADHGELAAKLSEVTPIHVKIMEELTLLANKPD